MCLQCLKKKVLKLLDCTVYVVHMLFFLQLLNKISGLWISITGTQFQGAIEMFDSNAYIFNSCARPQQ
jgi:hypothetical protein